jgi:hypothetical protein
MGMNKSEWLVAHLVRDEGVAGSNPATPTSFLVAPITYAASYAERNSPVIISRRRFTPIRSLGRSRERWLSLPALARAVEAAAAAGADGATAASRFMADPLI